MAIACNSSSQGHISQSGTQVKGLYELQQSRAERDVYTYLGAAREKKKNAIEILEIEFFFWASVF